MEITQCRGEDIGRVWKGVTDSVSGWMYVQMFVCEFALLAFKLNVN